MNDKQNLEPPSSEQASNSAPIISQLRAAVFQPPAPSNSIRNNPLGILTQAADCLRVASMHNIDLVLFPELYLTGGTTDVTNNGISYDSQDENALTLACASLDRESYELSIIGNLCAELNVACAMGYAEKKHASEIDLSNTTPEEEAAYNSIALFHADGTRAGNFRCTSDADIFLSGHPFVEVMPVNMNLPSRAGESRGDSQIKVGMAIGNEIFVPEHFRHLARSGAQILLASSASYSHGEHDSSITQKKCVLTTRAVENGVPILSSNYVGKGAGEILYNGSSGIVSSQGNDLVMAPEMEGGDMPCGEGYLLPCESGDLYAADIHVQGSNDNDNDTNQIIHSSLNKWGLTPHAMSERRNDDTSTRGKGRNGFGKEVEQIVKRNRKRNRKVLK